MISNRLKFFKLDTLDLYFFLEFIKYFFGALLLLVGVALIAKVMERLSTFLDFKGNPEEILKFLLYHIPYFITIVGAPSLMFSVSFVIANFSKSKELAVVLAAGRSFHRIMKPIVLFSLFFSIALFVLNEYVSYPLFFKANDQLQVLNNKVDYSRTRNIHNIHSRYMNWFFHTGNFLVAEKKIISFNIIKKNPNGLPEMIITAMSAQYINNNVWNLSEGVKETYPVNGDLIPKREKFKKMKIQLPVNNTFFERSYPDFEEMNIFMLQSEMNERRDRGEEYRKHEVEYYWHFSFPFVCFFIVFIGGILGSAVKKGAMSISIGISTILTLAYYIIMFFGKSFANNGTLPIILGAWIANIVFAIISIVIYFRYRS